MHLRRSKAVRMTGMTATLTHGKSGATRLLRDVTSALGHALPGVRPIGRASASVCCDSS